MSPDVWACTLIAFGTVILEKGMDEYCCLYEHNERFVGRCGNSANKLHYTPSIIKKYQRNRSSGSKTYRESTDIKKAVGANHDFICKFHYDFMTSPRKLNKKPKGWADGATKEIRTTMNEIMVRTLKEACVHTKPEPDCPYCLVSFAFSTRKRKEYDTLAENGRTQILRIKMAKSAASGWIGKPTELEGKIAVDMHIALSMLMTRNGMSQELYKRHKKQLKTQGVILPSLRDVQAFKKTLKIPKSWQCNTAGCVCAIVCIKETITMILKNDKLIKRMTFMTSAAQSGVFQELKNEAPLLYGNLDESRKTIWIRLSPDNFRTAGNKNAERVSYMILNFEEDTDNPFYEIFASIWQGGETRCEFQVHCGTTDGFPYLEYTSRTNDGIFNDFADLVVNGIKVNGEWFNVVVLLVPDMCCLETLLGRQTGTSENGDCFCTKKLTDKKNPDHDNDIYPLRSVKTIVENGRKAEKIYKDHVASLNGEAVIETRQPIKGIPLKCDGQKRSTLLSFVCIWTMPPDVLHLMLAMHRIAFPVLLGFAIETNTHTILYDAFKAMGATTLAHSFREEVKKRKGKISKDIMPTLNGNSCSILENRIGFLFTKLFEKKEETYEERKRSKGILLMYKLFSMLSQALRKKKCTVQDYDYLAELIPRVVDSIKKVVPLGKYIGSTYLHVLSNELLRFQKFWITHCGIGIGMFWTSPAEHSNKFVKEAELRSTNLSTGRFMMITDDQIIRMLYFSDKFDSIARNMVRCGSCGGPGHMMTNKSCPEYKHRYTFHPETYFDMMELSDENLKILNFNPYTKVYGDTPVEEESDEE